MNGKRPLIAGVGEALWDMLPTGKQCGGAPANVAYHARKLGADSTVVSAVGRDADGDELLELLTSKGLDCRFVTRNLLPTGTVSVSLENGIPAYDIHQPAAWDAIECTQELEAVLPEMDAVVFGSLAQRDPRSRETIRHILRSVPEKCLRVFDVNLRQDFYGKEMLEESLKLSNVFKLNEEECGVMSALFAPWLGREEILKLIAERFGLEYVILTLGADGNMLYDGREFTHYPVAPCPRIEDTVGCGDSFLAAWCVAILNGETPDAAMRAASLVSAKVAGQKGAMAD